MVEAEPSKSAGPRFRRILLKLSGEALAPPRGNGIDPDALNEIAKETEKSAAQVALNWVLSRRVITAPIIGARNVAQLNDNLGASGWSLTEEQVRRLNEVSELPVSYPYDLAAETQQRRGRDPKELK